VFLGLTATATIEAQYNICDMFGIDKRNIIRLPFHRQNLQIQRTIVASMADKDKEILTKLRNRPQGPTVIYVSYKKDVDRLTELLNLKVTILLLSIFTC